LARLHPRDVIKLQRGHDLPERLSRDGSVPVVSSSGVTGRHTEVKAEPPGVVTGRYVTIGEVFFLEEPYWPLNTALYVVDFKDNDPRFVSYLLRNTLRNYRTEKAAVPGVDRNVLHLLKVRGPDRTTQEGVVSILSAYDDLIENNRRRIALLEEVARMLYREWFVRFRFPGHETFQGHRRTSRGLGALTRNSVTCNALLASSNKDRSSPVERSPGDRGPVSWSFPERVASNCDGATPLALRGRNRSKASNATRPRDGKPDRNRQRTLSDEAMPSFPPGFLSRTSSKRSIAAWSKEDLPSFRGIDD
jgi:Type I restriction modification DNA specificity domain